MDERSGVQVADGRAGEGVGPGVGRAHACGDVYDAANVGGVHAAQLGYGGGGSGRAPMPVRVDVGTRDGRAAQPRGHFVSDYQRRQEVSARRALALGYRQQSGQYVDGGVSAAESVALVHFERDAGGGVHQRGAHGGSAMGRGDYGGLGGRHVLGRPSRKPQILRFLHTGGNRAQRIKRHVAGGCNRAGRQVGEREVGGELG